MDNRQKDLKSRVEYNQRRKKDSIRHEKDLECRKKWGENNKDKRYSYKRAYRAKKYGNGGMHTKKEFESLKKRSDNTCLRCFRQEPQITLTEDHILPLSKGGDDSIGNIQPLCSLCNSTKGVQHIDFSKGDCSLNIPANK